MKLIKAVLNDTTDQIQYMELNDAPIPEVQIGTVLVEVKACGISVISSEVLCELFKKQPQLQYPAGCEIAGIVAEVGTAVTSFKSGDKVAGIIPLDSSSSGLAQFCVCSEFDLVILNDDVSFETAAAVIGDGVKVYTALNYLGHLLPNETVLITDPLSSWGTIMVQLAKSWDAKVFAMMYDESKERQLLEKMDINYIVEGRNNKSITTNVMEETGGLGVDVIVDNGVRQFSSEEDCKLIADERDTNLPHKHDLLNCLAIGGRWVTSQHNLQLDPPNSEQLYLRCSTVGFLFEPVWTLAQAHMGRFQHILKETIQKLTTGVLKPNIVKVVNINTALDYLHGSKTRNRGKIVLKF